MSYTENDLNLTDEMISNILTDALETGAISYWVLDGGRVKRDSDLNVIEFTILAENNDEEEVEYIINEKVVVEGVKKLFSEGFNINDDILQSILCDDIDAEGTDCIIQAGIFGDVIYG